MNSEIKVRWVKALRGKRYNQGTGKLVGRVEKGKFKYCCLGVLCEIAKQDGLVSRIETSDERFFYGPRINGPVFKKTDGILDWTPQGLKAGYNDSYLPEFVKEWAELDNDNPNIPTEDSSLSSLNDAERTFAEIADFIEAEL